eukprot:gene7236-8044_t
MSVESSTTSTTSCSTTVNASDLQVHHIFRDERLWKPYFSNSDSAPPSMLPNGEDITVASLGFLYDYYGMTEETQHGPPSPGSSPFSASSEEPKMLVPDSSESSSNEGKPAFGTSKIGGMALSTHNAKSTSSSNVPISSVMSIIEAGRFSVESIIKAETSLASCQGTDLPIDDKNQPIIVNPFTHHQQQRNNSEDDRYINILEAPTSIIQRKNEDSLTYLNKGQFYAITCEHSDTPDPDFVRVKSIIYLVFRDEKDPRNELNNWHFWSSQQPNPNQRAFDVDRKACQNIEEVPEEVGYNAFAFTWNPHEKAKVVIRINCLSTDFSPQKGVKGIPLHLQVDTFEDLITPDVDPVHRAFCQMKVFRDKGAERKNKDESKSAERRLSKVMKQSPSEGATAMASIFQGPNKITRFNSVSDKSTKPWVFLPKNKQLKHSSAVEGSSKPPAPPPPPLFAKIRAQETKRAITAAVNIAKEDFEDLSVLPRHSKASRVIKRKAPAVTIYVRKEEEKVYNALMLENLTILDLKEAVAHKYGMPSEMIKNLYKKTRKGILVNMDDMMVEQFVDEDDFLIQVNFDNQLGHFELTFIY